EAGGVAYIYLCYGIHHLFNVVTGQAGQAHAILVRAIEPLENIALMQQRRDFTAHRHFDRNGQVKPQLTAGPGVMSKALGITKAFTGVSLTEPDSPIWIEDRGMQVNASEIIASPRVGIPYAEECIDWPWRFRVKESRWTSKAK
ncbi:MAG: DNA-3-methyladenine glycosylase, partial [Bacteroidota bacterium]